MQLNAGAQTILLAGAVVLQPWTPSPLSGPAAHSPVRFAHLSVADGLSNGDVRAIVQDRQGFIWVGTLRGGLNRYDGYTFRVYTHDDQNGSSIGGDSIRGLYVDRAGVMWVATDGGVDRYDRTTDAFVHYRHRADDPTGLPGPQGSSFAEDTSGRLWVTTSGGLARFDPSGNRFVAYRPAAGASTAFDTDMRALCFDTTGLLWISTAAGGVSAVDTSTGQSIQYKTDPRDPTSLSNDDVAHIFQDRAGAIWFSTQRGLNRFDPGTRRFTRYLHDPDNRASLSDDYVGATFEDRAGRFWVATNNGLNVMDRERGTFSRYLHDPNDPGTVSSNVINKRALYADTSGALWIGMRSTGVDRVPAVAERFTTYRHTSDGANTPSNNVITGLAMGAGGALWIGTEAGLDRFDGQSFAHYLASADDRGALAPGPQRLVVEGTQGTVWTGTYGGGLDRLNGSHVTHFRHDVANANSPGNDNIAGLVADPAGGLWIGVYGAGLDYFDGRRFIHFVPSADPAGLPNAYVTPLLLDADGMLWMTSNDSGLVRLDTKTRKFTSYLLDPARRGGPAANATQDIYADGAAMWIAANTGLFRFDPGIGAFTHHYTERDGLVNNNALAVLGDSQGDVWVSTTNGMSRFDTRTRTFRNYDMFDGLQGNGFSPACRARAADGRLFFGGTNGLTAFYPDGLADNTTPPPVALTAFEVMNTPVTIGGGALVLRHDQNVIRFQFAALNYDSPQKNRYAYKLEGFDGDWQHTDAARRMASYTNLDPGEYTFRVKASNNDGVWNEEGVAVRLTVLPPWWRTSWFRALVTILFVGLLWAAYQFRVRQLHQQFALTMDARVGERTRIARELHDTLLQTFHALLLNFQTVVNLLPDRPADARQRLEAALQRAAQAITEGRDAVQGLRASTAEGNNLASGIRRWCEELARESPGGAAPSFSVAVDGTPRDLHPIVRDEIFKIAVEAVRNAVRHACAHRIDVEVRYETRHFRLLVRDDGTGIDQAVVAAMGKEGHYGLRGMSERASVIGGRLVLWSEPHVGTEVELRVPGRAAYAVHRARLPWSPTSRSAISRL